MHIDTSTIRRGDKTYTRHLLRNSYRVNGKVCHDTIANLSQCTPEEITAMKLALKHKNNLQTLSEELKQTIQVKQGQSVGAVLVLKELAKNIGLEKALGNSEQSRLALWQIIARIIEQGSRLSAVRAASVHAACDILNLQNFNEDDLYKNLDWLHDNQHKIEDKLFSTLPKDQVNLFLYDVTSSYFEGLHNELAAFGYNRDGKRGKQQIVIGLLCVGDGTPISVEVFEGNTQDPKTLNKQLETATKRFDVENVTWIGDRGMIKSAQIEQINNSGFNYITAITKAQINTLCKNDIIQIGLFDEDLTEVFDGETNVRYILRRNPIRAQEIQETRASKYSKLEQLVAQKNIYLQQHSKADLEKAYLCIQKKAHQLNTDIRRLITVT